MRVEKSVLKQCICDSEALQICLNSIPLLFVLLYIEQNLYPASIGGYICYKMKFCGVKLYQSYLGKIPFLV